MIIIESIKEAFRSIWTNKVRSFLTILGIIIGIASVTSLVGIGEGFKGEFSNQVSTLGANTIFVVPGDIESATNGDSGFAGFSQTVTGSTLTKEDLETLKTMDHVQAVAGMNFVGGVTRVNQTTSATTMTVGFNADVFSILELTAEKGRVFTDEDNTSLAKVAVLSPKSATAFFGAEDPVGKTITIFNTEFEVIGVLAERENQSTSTFTSGMDDLVFVPIETAWDVMQSKNIVRVLVQVDEADQINATVDAVRVKLEAMHGVKDFSVLTQEDLVGVFDTVFGQLSSAILGIMAISLVVGGIGIMNIMLVSVTERTREIGLRKAVGATGFSILLQFITEAIVLSLLGGLIGYGASVVGGIIVSKFIGFSIPITVSAIMLAFGVSIGVGVVFGVAPAIRAAKKHPIEALRYE